MGNLAFLLARYWKKHKRSAFSLLFSGTLLVLVVVFLFLQIRTDFDRKLHAYSFDQSGMYELEFLNVPQDVQAQILEGKSGYTHSRIYVLGKLGMGQQSYTYGWLEDPDGLAHLPLEHGGRLPETENEVIVPRAVLNQWNWAGKVGSSITLDGRTYQVVGILQEQFEFYRRTELGPNSTTAPVPLLYIGKPNAPPEPAYQIDLYGSVGLSQAECDAVTELNYTLYPEDSRMFGGRLADGADDLLNKYEFRYDVNWLLMMAGIASVIAVLSIFSNLRGIFLERQGRIRLLHRIGCSRRRIGCMYALEWGIVTLLQTIVGALLGTLAYLGVFRFQVQVLELSDYSAFDAHPLTLERTYNPWLLGCLFSVGVMLAAYLITGLSTRYRPCSRVTRKRPGSLFANFSSIFRQRGITVIQFLALTLICTGTLLGYTYYTSNGKTGEYLNNTKVYVEPTYIVGQQEEKMLDMEQDGIAEYYETNSPNFVRIEGMNTEGQDTFILADPTFDRGLDDAAVEQFSGVTAVGCLEQTFLICDEPISGYTGKIRFTADEEKQAIVEDSLPQYQNFFEPGQLGTKELYRVQTRLTNGDTLERLRPYLTAGEINPEQLNAGKQVLLVLNAPEETFQVGETLHVGAALCNTWAGITDLRQLNITIGGIVVLPEDGDNLLRYAARSNSRYNFLTTAQGAAAAGLQNAAYTQLICPEPIDGGKLPPNSLMTLTSYEQLRQDYFIEKAMEYGGMVLIVVLMSLLGFSAYFSGIGMKIRMRVYEISVLRAIGTPVSRIRRRLMLDSMKLSVLACAAAGGIILWMQRIMEQAYEKMMGLEESMIHYEEIEPQVEQLMQRYFLANRCWSVPVAKPILLLLLVMCTLTLLLTGLGIRRFRGSIADSINNGRERQ